MKTQRIDCQEFKFDDVALPKGDDYIIGLDFAHGIVTAITESGHFCFPAIARQIPQNAALLMDVDNVFYRDDSTGAIWLVGKNALDLPEREKNVNEDEDLVMQQFTRSEFRVLCNVAIGLATINKVRNNDPRKIVIQSGSSLSHLLSDKDVIMDEMTNNLPFSLAIEGSSWTECQFVIKDVFLMSQANGGLISSIVSNDAKLVLSDDPNAPDARRVLTGNTLAIDVGPDTFDFYKKDVLSFINNKQYTDTNNRIYNYLIVDGIIDKTESMKIKERLASFGIRVFFSDQNDSYGMLYSNARGYYLYRLHDQGR